ncbi:MAG: valyl-tRNA synthetase [Candidatus Berkelbacteria bacterium Athens1014_28]|uniref:Valine--tRNA ligase n=1 Tax=Candidatus Berkelbacteria bacterium Athens1014_28 TaxID=2017145 RepID=A0A554LNH5_9BACT|nr:MAG: valyl-tRNA synthetase [Candidatus Berkelbacteria bacterium Athens1014_28]
MAKIFSKNWQHGENEGEIYKNWESKGFFKPFDFAQGRPFVISMPPPNITGKLHIGHALTITIEDIMTRYHRMLGEPTLWLPGTDHAGIATQAVVDKNLRKKGINKNEIGREKFVEEVWKWKEEYGGEIVKQLRAVGASCDWSRERFTLDEDLSKAVNEAFVRLYKKGLIYRGEYIVNWCPKCGTAISDDEVEHEPQKSKLYYFKYDKNFPITIATTRPETKLGDTAVAVNPSDERYKKYVGQIVDINLDGVKRKIKIIADRAIDKDFGTGALGVTPAHSMADWKMAEENNLEKVKVIDEHGRMIGDVGDYLGLKVLEAREKLVEYLKSKKLLEKEEEIENNLSVCYRCGGAIEPLPSLQWFVKMEPLAEKARNAVESGEIKIIPKRFEKVYFHWLDNIRDWCISRQLWWGHRIPVWYASEKLKVKSEKLNEKEIYIGDNPPADWIQDEDVLDTWFSSALWPFSTLDWPDESSSDFQNFYPTTVMETAYDILFFWVARMIMMGLELTGKIPFETVYFHGLVRDEQNRKMSKSFGNALDPLVLIEKYGADALRMALVIGTTPGQDMAIGESKIKGMRNFSNKIWNASRFVALRVSDGNLQSGEVGGDRIDNLDIDEKLLTSADKKILESQKSIKSKVKSHIEKFQFSLAAEESHNFFWHDFCDTYIESAKNQLVQLDKLDQLENSKKILLKVLSESLVLLHPFMPFVTEAVWQELREICPDLSESIMTAEWPE